MSPRIALRSLFALTAALCIFTAAQAGAQGTRKTFAAADGVQLVGDIYLPAARQKPPVVLLLHMLGHTRRDFGCLIAPLTAQGFAVVNVDLRGHGDSTWRSDKSRTSFQQFSDADWQKLPLDAQKVIQDLQSMPAIDGKKIAIVGASIGANTAAIVGATDPRVKAEVLLSPGLEYHKMAPAEYMRRGPRPAWLLAGRGDSYSAQSVKQLEQLDPTHIHADVLDTRAHGTDLLSTNPELAAKIAAWLKGQLP